jgi:hypothetical protein
MTADSDILQMIEAADPSDTAKLDEIDARVWCWLNSEKFESVSRCDSLPGDLCIEFYHPKKGHGNGFRTSRDLYTRSRDALKAIRPKQLLQFGIDADNYGWRVTIDICPAPGKLQQIRHWKRLPTEELAELHAVVETIAFERSLLTPAPESDRVNQ